MATTRIQKRMVRPTSLRNTRRTTNNNLRRRRTNRRQRPLHPHRQTVRRRRHETSSRSKPLPVNLAGIKPRMETMTAATDTRDKAIAQVATNTDPAWWQQTMLIIKQIATDTFDFTTDDIWRELATAPLPTPHEPRALGALMIAAHRAGLITPTDRYRQSKRPECHARPIRVWQAT